MDMSSAGLDYDPDVFQASPDDDFLSSLMPGVDAQDGNPTDVEGTIDGEEEEDDDGEEEDEEQDTIFTRK